MKTIHRRLTILIAAAALSLGAITTLLLVGARGPADPASSTSVQALYTIGQYEGQVAVFRVDGLDLSRKFRLVHHRDKFLTASAREFLALCRAQGDAARERV